MSEELKSAPVATLPEDVLSPSTARVEEMRAEQNVAMAWVSGGAAAVLGATLWAVITVLTNYQIGWMAVGVGALVGVAIRHFGKGVDAMFGYIGAVWALLGCALGNLLTVCIIISRGEGVPLVDLLSQLTPGLAVELMSLTFSPIDLLFYALALQAGYKLSIRQAPAAWAGRRKLTFAPTEDGVRKPARGAGDVSPGWFGGMDLHRVKRRWEWQDSWAVWGQTPRSTTIG